MKTLTSRPYLKLEPSALREISNNLSMEASAREEFMNSPQKFLQQKGINLNSGSIFLPEYNTTSEACTLWLVCGYAVLLGAVTVIVAAAATVAAVSIYLAYYAAVATQVVAYGVVPGENFNSNNNFMGMV